MRGPPVTLERPEVLRGGRVVLRGEWTTCPAGGLTVIEGPNGAGKSSLLLAVAGLLDLATGCIRLGDATVFTGRAPAPIGYRNRYGLAFQEPFLFAGSVESNLLQGLRYRGVARHTARQRISALADELGFAGLLVRPARQLSGGERKLVDVARALVLGSSLILLDEPTNGLTPAVAGQVEAAIAQRVRDGCTVLWVTHDVSLARRLGNDRLWVESGRSCPGCLGQPQIERRTEQEKTPGQPAQPDYNPTKPNR